MKTIRTARKLLAGAPDSEAAKTLARVVLTLESDEEFDLGRLYAVDLESFHLALDILDEWRSGKCSGGMAKLFRLSARVDRMSMT